jgi:hypothetical protein
MARVSALHSIIGMSASMESVIIYIGRHGDHEWSIDGLEVLNPVHRVAGVVRHALTL